MSAAHSTTHRTALRPEHMHYLRGKLLEKRQLLLGLIQAELAGTDEPAGLPNDPVDIASSISARETSYAVGSVESDTIAQIDYILRKLDNGKYGICEDCGKRISPARLRVIPFASLCVMCKASEEKEAPRLTGEDRAEMKDLASVLDIRDGEEEAVREMLRVSRLA